MTRSHSILYNIPYRRDKSIGGQMYIQICMRKFPGKTTRTKINSFKSGSSGIELELSNV